MSSTPPIILVTGATGGIGQAIVRQLLARGARVILTSRDASRAREAAEALDPGCFPLGMDPLDSASTAAAYREIAARYSRLDVLIHNAAILEDRDADLATLDPALLTRTFETNVTGPLQLTQALLPLLRKSAAPRLIHVSSRAGQLTVPPPTWAPAYSISKAALNMLTLQCAAAFPDLAVNSMSPGWCRTAMGGAEAPRRAEEGADTAVWLALDAPQELRGQFLADHQPIPW
jgi:NAD(P)-dependent dehydrogenase (short-subunit alcohol dehydrogenase family)